MHNGSDPKTESTAAIFENAITIVGVKITHKVAIARLLTLLVALASILSSWLITALAKSTPTNTTSKHGAKILNHPKISRTKDKASGVNKPSHETATGSEGNNSSA